MRTLLRRLKLLSGAGGKMYRDIKVFPNLTSLRFIAAYLVVIYHLEETRKMFGLPNLTRYSLFTLGPLAVTFFFVLSGFLITYLLLREYDRHGGINIRCFYMRRVLRIWPLYFLLVFIGLVLIPAGVKLGRVPYDAPFKPLDVAPYFLMFVPFIVNLMYGNHFLTPLWSVGIEEIYYLLWAPLVKLLRKHLLTMLVGTVVLKTLLAVWFHSVFQNALASELLRMLQFEAMAIGGLAALFLFNRRQPLDAHWLFAKPIQLLFVALILVRLLFHNSVGEFCPPYAAIFGRAVITPLLHMAIFAWLILNSAANERSFVRFDSPALNYLGDISYGIYMYHALPISLLVVPLLKTLRAAPFLPATLLLHLSVAAITLLCAAASKAFFEGRFLHFKRFFQVTSHEPHIIDLAAQAPTRPARVAAA